MSGAATPVSSVSSYTVEDLSCSLIREFLVQKNLNETLKTFNAELKKEKKPITRSELIRQLCLEKLYCNNQVQINEEGIGYKTLIEIFCGYLHSKAKSRAMTMGFALVPGEMRTIDLGNLGNTLGKTVNSGNSKLSSGTELPAIRPSTINVLNLGHQIPKNSLPMRPPSPNLTKEKEKSSAQQRPPSPLASKGKKLTEKVDNFGDGGWMPPQEKVNKPAAALTREGSDVGLSDTKSQNTDFTIGSTSKPMAFEKIKVGDGDSKKKKKEESSRKEEPIAVEEPQKKAEPPRKEEIIKVEEPTGKPEPSRKETPKNREVIAESIPPPPSEPPAGNEGRSRVNRRSTLNLELC